MSVPLYSQALWLDAKLTLIERAVLGVLVDHENTKIKDRCFPSQARIAQLIDKSIRTIKRAIRSLRLKKLIDVIRRQGTNLYRLLIDKFPRKVITNNIECHFQGAKSVPSEGPSMSPKSLTNYQLNKKQAKNVCVIDSVIEDQELALNTKKMASPAVAPEETTILADIESTENEGTDEPETTTCAQFCLSLQEYLNMFQYDKPASYRIKRAWQRLNDDDKALIKELLPQYINETVWKSSGIQGKVYRCNPAKWLNERRWTEIKSKRKPAPKAEPKPQPVVCKVVSVKDLEHLDKAKEYLDANYEQVKHNFDKFCTEFQRNWFDIAEKITSDKWLIDHIILNEHRYKLMEETS